MELRIRFWKSRTDDVRVRPERGEISEGHVDDGDERVRPERRARLQGAGGGVRGMRQVVCGGAGVDAAEQVVRALGDFAWGHE